MTALDTGFAALRTAAGRVVGVWDRTGAWFNRIMPKGLYARTLLIIIAPVVILQSVVAFVFMERHWHLVTQRLSAGVVHDIAALIEVHKDFPQERDNVRLRRIAQEKLRLVVDFLPATALPPPGPKPFFSLLDQALSEEIRKQIGRPFWIDTVGRSSLVEPQCRLCVEFPYLSGLDGRNVTGPTDGRDTVSAQPDPSHSAACRCSGKFRHGPRGTGFPSAWCA
jgi:two-component system osmolarity sensor histidine kinase EnvZ